MKKLILKAGREKSLKRRHPWVFSGAVAKTQGDPRAGERIFFHLRVGGCFRCHEFEGRGYTVGPDLSTIGRSMTRERLVQSLVDPSREIGVVVMMQTLPFYDEASMKVYEGVEEAVYKNLK